MCILNDANLEREQFYTFLLWRPKERKTAAPAQFGLFDLIKRAHQSVWIGFQLSLINFQVSESAMAAVRISLKV